MPIKTERDTFSFYNEQVNCIKAQPYHRNNYYHLRHNINISLYYSHSNGHLNNRSVATNYTCIATTNPFLSILLMSLPPELF